MTDPSIAASAGPPTKRNAGFGFIFFTALLNALSFGLMIPVLPNLIKQFVGGDFAMASDWNVVFATTWGAMQFVCGPVLGMLSDRYGRRPVMLVSIAGLGVDYLFMAFAPTLWWLLLGRVLNGMTASSFATANAYLADVTPPELRAKNFGMLGSAFSFGFLVGPSMGGFLGSIDLRLPFMVAAGLCAVNFVYGYLVLPESLAPEKRITAIDWRKANPVGALTLLRSHRDLLALAVMSMIFWLAQNVLPNIFILYTGYRFHWDLKIQGLTFIATGAAGIIVQMFLVGPVVKRIGERGAVLLGATCGMLGFLIYALAPTGPIFMCAVPVFAGMSFLMPGLQGLMTQRIGPRQQGQLQGANQGLQGIAAMVGPSLYGLTFAWAVRNDATLHMPGFPILIAAALMGFNLLIGLYNARPRDPTEALEPSPAP
jgi:DHA1 family tetracycline resistance protein-like MFS transporter